MVNRVDQQPTYEDAFISSNGNSALNVVQSMSYRHWSVPQNQRRENAPPFLLIHGLASARRIWDFTAPLLVQRTGGTATAIDQRGHGLSDKPATGYDTAQIVMDDYHLAQALHLDQPVLIGHSWGASIALAYAAAHPADVRAVVLVDGGMGDMQDRPGATWETISVQLAPPEFAGIHRDHYLNFFRHERNWKYFEPVWSPALEDTLLNIVELRADDTVAPRLSRANHMQILRSLWETRNTELARQVTCPVLMISAESPESVDWAQMKRAGAARLQSVLKQSPKAEFVALPDTVHDIPLQRPAVLSETILRFLVEAQVLPVNKEAKETGS